MLLLTYQASIYNAGKTVLSKMMIDGAEQVGTRSIAGATNYGSNLGVFLGNLPAGKHTVEIQYRGDSTGSDTPSSDW